MAEPPSPKGEIVWNQAKNAVAVTKSDTVPLSPNPSRWIWVGGAGTLVVVLAGDPLTAPVTIAGIPAGTLLPIAATYIMAATTATLIVALY